MQIIADGQYYKIYVLSSLQKRIRHRLIALKIIKKKPATNGSLKINF